MRTRENCSLLHTEALNIKDGLDPATITTLSIGEPAALRVLTPVAHAGLTQRNEIGELYNNVLSQRWPTGDAKVPTSGSVYLQNELSQELLDRGAIRQAVELRE